MKRPIVVLMPLLFAAATAGAALQNDKPQPVDSARAEQDPEQREPPRKAIPPLADDKRSETSTKSFDQLDENKDGKLSKDELGADEAIGLEFSKIDRDGDGTISRDEWNAHWTGRHDKH
jgi:hypothetical protein